MKLTPGSSLTLPGRYASSSVDHDQTAHISLQKNHQCQKAKETKSRKMRHSSDAPAGRSFPDCPGSAIRVARFPVPSGVFCRPVKGYLRTRPALCKRQKPTARENQRNPLICLRQLFSGNNADGRMHEGFRRLRAVFSGGKRFCEGIGVHTESRIRTLPASRESRKERKRRGPSGPRLPQDRECRQISASRTGSCGGLSRGRISCARPRGCRGSGSPRPSARRAATVRAVAAPG